MTITVPIHVIDSSVVYKWFNDESESHVEEALSLLEAHRRGDVVLVAPAHMPAEVLNGLRYAGLDVETLRMAGEALFEAEIVIVPIDAELASAALDLAVAHALTVHDALFAALAVQLDSELVTADRAQARVTECPVRLLA